MGTAYRPLVGYLRGGGRPGRLPGLELEMIMQSFKLSALLFSLAVSLGSAACGGGSSGPATASTTPKPTADAADPSCPVVVAGTSVTVEDASNGAALVFVTTGDVAEVRRRAGELARMHNEHHAAMGPLPDGTEAGDGHAGHAGHGGGGDGDAHAGHGGHAGHHGGAHAGHGGAHAGHMGGMIGVHSKATASDVEGGAKVLFVAGGGDVGKLQGELRMHAQHLAAGTCAMGKSS